MRSPKLYFIDLRLFLLMVAWAFWPRAWTLVPVLAVMAFLVVAGHKGYRPGAAVRAIRRRAAGRPRALAPRRYRRIVDYGVAAGAAVLLALGGGGGARAAFEYIPPVREAAPTLEMPAAPDGATATGELAALPPAPVEEPAPEWVVRAGTTLEAVLGEWAARAGVEVVMLTDRQYLIGSSHVFRGAFADAVRALLFGLGHLRYAPVGQLLEGGRVLAVYHRAPEGEEGVAQ